MTKSMSDIQARVKGLLDEHRYVWTGERCQCGKPCGYVEHPVHVAAVLAGDKLLTEPMPDLESMLWGSWREYAESMQMAYNSVRAELIQMTEYRDNAAARMRYVEDQIVEWKWRTEQAESDRDAHCPSNNERCCSVCGIHVSPHRGCILR